MVAEKFQVYSVKSTANIIFSRKIESVIITPPRQTGIAHSSHFLKIFFSEKAESEGRGRGGRWRGGGEDYGTEKITKIKKGIDHKF